MHFLIFLALPLLSLVPIIGRPVPEEPVPTVIETHYYPVTRTLIHTVTDPSSGVILSDEMAIFRKSDDMGIFRIRKHPNRKMTTTTAVATTTTEDDDDDLELLDEDDDETLSSTTIAIKCHGRMSFWCRLYCWWTKRC